MMRLWMKGLLGATLAVATLPAADELTGVREILAREQADTWIANDLRQALSDLDPTARPAALALVAETRRSEFIPVARDLLSVSDPAVVSAAIDVVAASWPTTAEDAVAIRRLIGNGDERVASAAIAFATQIQDDLAVPTMADRLLAHPDDAAVRKALVELSGHDAENGMGWHDWHRQQTTHVTHLLGQLESRLSAEDPKEVMVAVSLLLGERGAPALIADHLLALVDHPDAQVRNLVSSALAVNPSAAAACWRAERGSADTLAITDDQVPADAVKPAAGATIASAPVGATMAAGSAASTGTSSWMWLLGIGGLLGAGWWWRRARKTIADPAAAVQVLPVNGGKKRRISVTWAE